MSEEDKIHINSFKFYDRDELEDLTKKYYLENKKLKYELEQCKAVADTNIELAESFHKEIERLKSLLKCDYEDSQDIMSEFTSENQQLKEQLQQKEDIINEITNYCKFQIEKEQDKFPKPIESEEWLKGRISAFEEILDNKGDENDG